VGSPCHPLRGSFKWRIASLPKEPKNSKVDCKSRRRGACSCAFAHFLPMPFGGVRWPPDIAWLASRTGTHRGLAICEVRSTI
jgi:hypothetical protein